MMEENNGRKIPIAIENPFDNILIHAATQTNPLLRSLGFTPNMLTFLALCTGLMTAYAVYKGWFLFAAILVLVSYFFDTLDGNMARMYNMVSSFGDIFDHVSDVVKYASLYIAVYNTRFMSIQFKIVFYIVTLFVCLFILVHVGCQEKSYDKQHTDTLSLLEMLCPNADMIHVTKYIGIGTWIYILIVFMILASVHKTSL